MRFSKSIATGILGVIFLILLLGVAMLIVDERASRSLENVDLTWDELDPKPTQQVPYAKEKK
jgi:hypothetical protein